MCKCSNVGSCNFKIYKNETEKNLKINAEKYTILAI
jgi:hypothetical protein